MNRFVTWGLLVAAGTMPAFADGIAVGGRVLVPGGDPLPRADVQLLRSVGDTAAAAAMYRGETAEPVARVLTDESGRFRIEAPHAGLWVVRVEARGFAPREIALTPLIEPIELVDATLPADAGLTVRVQGSDGRPVGDAFVLIRSERTRFGGRDRVVWEAPLDGGYTADDGTIRLPHGQDDRFTVTASAPGSPVAERRGLLGTSAGLRLPAGVDRRVAAKTSDGAAVVGAMALEGGRPHPIGATDEDGIVHVSIAPGATEELRVRADDGREATTRVLGAAAQDPKPQVVTLPDSVLAGGRLIDADSRRPVPGAVVYDAMQPTLAAVTDRAGGFAIRGNRGERLELTAGAPGYLPPARTIELSLADDGRPGPTLALRPAAAIEGKVVDLDSSPVAGAELTLEEQHSPAMIRIEFGGRATTSRVLADANGRYRLSRIDPSKTYAVKARADGFAPAETSVVGLEPYKTKSGVDVKMSRGRTLTGTVATADGEPVAEANVTIEEASDAGRMGMMRVATGGAGLKVTGVTNGDGRFSVGGLPGGKFDVSASRHGFATGEIKSVEIAQETGGSTDAGTIVLELGETVQGVVLDTDGVPIEGAEIRASTSGGAPMMMMVGGGSTPDAEEPDAVSDSAGWFSIADLSSKKKYTLAVQRTGYVDGRAGPLGLPRPEPVTVNLAAASTVRGVVLDEGERPIAGAKVDMTRSRTIEMGNNVMKMVMMDSATSDGEGRFVFEDQEPGEISLKAAASGYQESKLDGLTIPTGEDLDGVELKLPGGAVVTGQVFGPDGQPVIDASVQVAGEGEEFMRRMSGAPSDGSGVYRLDGLGPGKVSIEATHEDWPRTVRDIDLDVGVNYLDLHFEGGVEVQGRVSDGTGQAVGGAAVRLAAAGRAYGGPETITDASGEYRMPGVQDGDYRLWVEATGYAASAGEIDVKVDGQPVYGVDVQLNVGSSITGRVSGVDEARFGDVTVQAEGRAFSGFGVGVDSQGGYRIENLDPGDYTVVATVANSGKRASGEVKIEPGVSDVALDLVFESGLTLSGVAMQAGEPVRGATVYVEGTSVQHSGWNETDHDGRFEIDGLEPGEYDVRLRHWQTGLAYDESVSLTASREITLEVPTARVGGRIVDATDREPLAGVKLALTADSSSTVAPNAVSVHDATSDLEGKFEFGNVGDGNWTLTASKQGYAAETRSVQVQSGRTVDDLRLELAATEGVTLETRLPTGSPPAEVQVAVLDASGGALVSGSYATGENGRVRLSSVPPGQWTAVISAAGAATSRVEVQSPGPTVSVPLAPPTSLRVRVPELAGPTLATVRLADAGGRPFYRLSWTGRAENQWQMQGGVSTFDRLPPGTWTVSVTAPDGRTWQGSQTTTTASATELTLE